MSIFRDSGLLVLLCFGCLSYWACEPSPARISLRSPTCIVHTDCADGYDCFRSICTVRRFVPPKESVTVRDGSRQELIQGDSEPFVSKEPHREQDMHESSPDHVGPTEDTSCIQGTQRPCGTSDQGECSMGVEICSKEGTWMRCQGAVEPKPEACNGKDDNCDGQIDETFPTKEKTCSTQRPEPCHLGRYECRKGRIECVLVAVTTPEKCNGKDDDCDGKVDNLPKNQAKKTCTLPQMKGVCKDGEEVCKEGTWKCVGLTQPGSKKEVCKDGKDNDCDGHIDEKDECFVVCQSCQNNKDCGTNTRLNRINLCADFHRVFGEFFCFKACQTDADCNPGFSCAVNEDHSTERHCWPDLHQVGLETFGIWYCQHYAKRGKKCSKDRECGPILSSNKRGAMCHKKKCALLCQKDKDCPDSLSCTSVSRRSACLP